MFNSFALAKPLCESMKLPALGSSACGAMARRGADAAIAGPAAGMLSPMGSIGRYMFRATMGAFLITLVSLTVVIWFTQAMRDFDLITSQRQTLLVFVGITGMIIPLLIPIALKGVQYRALGADALLRRNLLVWGLGGVIVPFIGIKAIDVVMVALHFVA